jgi:hypothetical protein
LSNNQAPGNGGRPHVRLRGALQMQGYVRTLDDRTPQEIIAKFRTRTGEQVGGEFAGDLVRWLEAAGLVIVTREEARRLTKLGAKFASEIAASGANSDAMFRANEGWLRDDLRGMRAVVVGVLLVCSMLAFVAAVWSSLF